MKHTKLLCCRSASFCVPRKRISEVLREMWSLKLEVLEASHFNTGLVYPSASPSTDPNTSEVTGIFSSRFSYEEDQRPSGYFWCVASMHLNSEMENSENLYKALRLLMRDFCSKKWLFMPDGSKKGFEKKHGLNLTWVWCLRHQWVIIVYKAHFCDASS